MTKAFEFVSDLSEFAKSRGIKVVHSKITDRRNHIGEYEYIEIGFLCPKPEEKYLENVIADVESHVNNAD